MKLEFKTRLQKYDQQGEKTGWTYILIPEKLAQKLKPGARKTFRVAGMLDEIPIKGMAILPIGEGDYILPLKADLRKKLGKQRGDEINISLEEDQEKQQIHADLLACLEDEPLAKDFFQTLTKGHQRYFSNWITEAKTTTTKTKRIAQCIEAFIRKWDFGQMIRNGRKQPFNP